LRQPAMRARLRRSCRGNFIWGCKNEDGILDRVTALIDEMKLMAGASVTFLGALVFGSVLHLSFESKSRLRHEQFNIIFHHDLCTSS
jgi:hypothetical protein